MAMDKTSKQIMKYLSSKGKGSEYVCRFDEEFESLSISLHVPLEDLRASVRWMESNGILEYQRYGGGQVSGFHLSHVGVNWRYFRRKEILKYVEEKWIDFFSLLASVAALIIFIIAPVSTRQG